MKKFFIKLFLFLLPFAPLLGFPFYVLFVSGELTPVEKVIEEQASGTKSFLFGLAYSNPDKYYKFHGALAKHPDILVLGTSRVMQLRSEFFKKSFAMYNAGGGVAKIKHFKHFLDKLPSDGKPQLVIVGMDQYFFNANWDVLLEDDIEQQLTMRDNAFIVFTGAWQRVYGDYYHKKYFLSGLREPAGDIQKLGLNAVVNGNGFRNDGSYYYGQTIHDRTRSKTRQEKLDLGFKQIHEGIEWYTHGKEISSGAVRELRAFLEECRKRHIYVIGFLPPFAHQIYMKLKSMPEYRYMERLMPALSPVFKHYGFALYDFSDLASVGASDLEIVDSFHGSEKAYLRLFIKMAETNAVLKRYAGDIETLRTKLHTSQSHIEVFRN